MDVGEGQTTVDLASGRPVQVESERLRIASRVCAAHPYPGDLGGEGARWVTDTALDLVERHRPDYMLLDYASLYLPAVFKETADAERSQAKAALFGQIERFLAETDYEPLIIGLGDMIPFRGYVDTTDLDGTATAAGMNTRAAGIFGPSAADLRKLEQRDGVERVNSREQFRAELGGSDDFYQHCADTIVLARDGFVFRGVNTSCHPLHQLPRPEKAIPLHCRQQGCENIAGVAPMVLQMLRSSKVVLILVEAVGVDTMPLPFRPINNTLQWYRYSMGPGQYLAITSGRHFVDYPYPPGYRLELFDDESSTYPFSGTFRKMPDQTIGRRFRGRSAAVGNRSILTHLAAGTDIAIECFARGLYNQGVMAVVRTDA